MSKRSGIMLCYPLEEKRLLNQIRGCYWSWPVFVQPKLDGERCRAKDGNYLISSELNSFNHTVPHIKKAYQELCIKIGYCPEFDGELYEHGMNFEDIHSRVSTSRLQPHEDYSSIKYHIFDIIDEEKSQLQRISDLLSNLDFKSPLIIVPTIIAHNISQIMEIYQHFVGLKYEGIVVREATKPYVRQRSPYILKFKPKKTDEYLIVDFQEEISKDGIPKNTLGSLICEKDGHRFSTGSGTLTDIQKQQFWDDRLNLPGKICKVWYQNITAKEKVPRFISKIEILDKPETNHVNPFLNIGG